MVMMYVCVCMMPWLVSMMAQKLQVGLKLILSMWDPLCEYKRPIAIGVGQRSLRSA